MFVYYYKKDSFLELNGHKQSYSKGKVYMLSELDNLCSWLGCVEMNLTTEQYNNLAFLIYDEENKKLYIDKLSRSEYEKNLLRIKRERLLTAFDKYKSNISIGIETDSLMRKDILNWYLAILDLNEDAMNNPPERIKYYIV